MALDKPSPTVVIPSPHERSALKEGAQQRGHPVYIEPPVSSTDFRSLRIQAQPPVPISENLLATMPAMIGAPSSSRITLSLEKPAATFSISHVSA